MASTHLGVRRIASMADRAEYHQRNMVEVNHIRRITTGDDIEALVDGWVQHRGSVAEILPEMGLFWIFDENSQQRKLIELDEFTILVRENPATKSPSEEPS